MQTADRSWCFAVFVALHLGFFARSDFSNAICLGRSARGMHSRRPEFANCRCLQNAPRSRCVTGFAALHRPVRSDECDALRETEQLMVDMVKWGTERYVR
jgi:hypothetical protein